MPNLLQQAKTTLVDTLRTNAATAVTYVRGSDSVSLTAVKGRSNHPVTLSDGSQEEVQSIDWIIRRADLVIDGVAVEPRRGDKIIQVLGDVTITHELLGDGGEGSWRYSDQFRTAFRIHTKVVGEVES